MTFTKENNPAGTSKRRSRLNTWISLRAHKKLRLMSYKVGIPMSEMIERYINYLYGLKDRERIKHYGNYGIFPPMDGEESEGVSDVSNED